ncbi:hypothetical protein B0H15DRAFT_944899 [Mycena belliarum]|uniref:Arrestin-like N-terminal domain-containing protein n=1 Tax=Mycena belliarum TaxID=1033014 RepID=A0AAD6UD71_9AGAR|nr:hypothetical protein B0H15DRAFT_944899 [Mycena belliae]
MSEAIALHFFDCVRVAGETLQGHVDVNIPIAMQDKMECVRVKLRGSIVTKVTETHHNAVQHSDVIHNKSHHQVQTIQILRIDQTVWDQSRNAQGAQVVSCPFQIQLPPVLPPSFIYERMLDRTAVISYSLEVEGVRHGLLHVNRRIRRIFSVVPPATPWEFNASAALHRGWTGPWKPFATNKEIRHGVLFGEHAQAKIEVVLPDLPSFPMVTGIPFSFHVLTTTKQVHHKDLEDKRDKLFPAPPTSPADVELRLHRRGRMSAHFTRHPIDDRFDLAGSLGDQAAINQVRMRIDEPEWIHTPDQKEDKGNWKRAVHFDGLMSIPFVPDYTTETVEWHYFLRFKVDFPGIGNDLELDIPVHINSGAAIPPLPQYNTNVPYQYPTPAGPPPMMTLPPAYWSGEHHFWDETQ